EGPARNHGLPRRRGFDRRSRSTPPESARSQARRRWGRARGVSPDASRARHREAEPPDGHPRTPVSLIRI
ncbi:hypothetical protein AVDCRST_MAG82-1007, partial [uncultured Rubrobacteraceae bacterium]